MKKRKLRRLPVLATFLMLSVAALSFVAAGEAVTEDVTENEKIATAEEMTTVDEVVEDWMVPITADQVENGVYEVEVRSSSHMFPITEALLVVGDEQMQAVLTLEGDGYLYVYPGTPQEAVEADEADYIAYETDDEGRQTYTIPVSALDAGIKCASFSRKKEKWYDRTLVFLSDSLPEGTVPEAARNTVEDLGLTDGAYTVEATLQGGSGKASITSPANLYVESGEATLEVIFSSPNYDYMLVEGERYEPVNEEGDSTFLIPVDGFDYSLLVIADTTAMSKPHEIEYAIVLDSASIQATETIVD